MKSLFRKFRDPDPTYNLIRGSWTLRFKGGKNIASFKNEMYWNHIPLCLLKIVFRISNASS